MKWPLCWRSTRDADMGALSRAWTTRLEASDKDRDQMLARWRRCGEVLQDAMGVPRERGAMIPMTNSSGQILDFFHGLAPLPDLERLCEAAAVVFRDGLVQKRIKMRELLEEALTHLGNHSRHWDRGGNSGATCPVCVEHREFASRVRKVLCVDA